MGDLLKFYKNENPNHEGVYLKDIWNFNEWELENTHHFIQWMFPLELKSNHYDKAPVASNKDIKEFLSDKTARENLLHSLNIIENFWGFDVKHTDKSISRPATFPTFLDKGWVTPYNHNFIRITRVIHSLVVFGCEKEANELVQYLEEEFFPTNRHVIGDEMLDTWKSALNKKVA